MSPSLILYRDVEGSFFTRLCARNEDSMGFSSGGGWELFSAEYVAAIAPCEERVGEVIDHHLCSI